MIVVGDARIDDGGGVFYGLEPSVQSRSETFWPVGLFWSRVR
jgi:hypothetical protein